MNRSILNKKKDRKGLYVVAGFVVAVCASLYPIVVYPYLNIGKYQEAQKINRKDIDAQKVQPANMRIWSDPFAPRDN